MPITDEPTDKLRRMLTVEEIKNNLNNSSTSAREQKIASREATRDALWDFGNRAKRALAEGFGVNVLNRVPESDMNGSVLYDYRAKQQPQPVQQPQVQTPPVANVSTAQPAQPAVQRPVQRPVARPQQIVAQPAPVQQPQQQVEPNITTDILNAYMNPEYTETIANSTPVAQETDMQVAEQSEQPEKAKVIADILGQIKEGYSDNRDNGFDIQNLQGDESKTGWNRFGEALGTTARVAGNPLVQGLVAGAINGKVSGNWGKGLEYGLQYAQNKAKSDAYERAMGKRPSILGGYGVDDYKAKVESDYKQNKINIDNEKLDIEKDKAEYYKKNIDNQIEHRKTQDQQGWAKIQAQISNNNTRLAETKTHNIVMEQIQANRAIDNQTKHMINIEDKIYKANRSRIMNDSSLDDKQKALQLYDIDEKYANNLRSKFGVDYKSMEKQVDTSNTKSQAVQNTTQNTKKQTKQSTGNGWVQF